MPLLHASLKSIGSVATKEKWRHQLDTQGQLNLWSLVICCCKVRTHPSFDACSHYLQVPKGSDQKQQRKNGETIFTIISIWGYFSTFNGR